MKSCWKILGIEPTDDKTEIKKVFARLVKLNPPSKDPERYQEIREAYDEAIKHDSIKNCGPNENISAFHEKFANPKEANTNPNILDEQDDSDELDEKDEAAEKIHKIREEVFNKGSIENLRHEAIKKEKGKFTVLAIPFIPLSLVMLYSAQKKYGGIPCIVFNLLCGFAIASIAGKFDEKKSKNEKNDMQKTSVGKEQIAGDNVSTSLIFRFIITIVLCIVMKIMMIIAKVPPYMHHYFGGVLFFYFAYNLHYLKR